MNLLLDASVAVKWIFNETDSANAHLLLDHRYTLFAPELMLVEAANVVWKKRIRSEITTVTDQIEWLNQLPSVVELLRSTELVGEATNLAVELEHPVYDCVYLACAAANNIPLVTADRRLLERATDTLRDTEVVDLASFPVHQ